jgi:hypothetical protein
VISIIRKGSTHNGREVFINELKKLFGEVLTEYRVCKERLWRHDYFIPSKKLAIEIEGGIWMKDRGAHSTPKAILRDIEKGNAALVAGHRVYRVPFQDLSKPDLILAHIANISKVP